ncbi:hypothetical protein AB0J38_29555 [Streptomyces sp. NPDC050095]|uniref:hypothetical protein n=1 Tax=unclassified Streptomyces TaxID=2593676 RepID=UPI003434261D
MNTLNLSFGRVHVEREDSPKEKPWLTTYRLTGPRIRGTVEIAPTFSELGKEAWEFMPRGLIVAYGRSTFNPGGASGTLEVLGSRLAAYTVVHPAQTDYRFTVRRNETGVGDYPAPPGARNRTREIVEALVILHRDDLTHVYEKAVAYLRSRQHTRLNEIERDYREVDQQLCTLQARHTALQKRRALMGGAWAFESAIEDAAPAA